VTDFIAPGYSLEIEHPMDLSTIKKNINRNQYLSLEEFGADVKLMYENCALFNGPESDYTLVRI